MHTDTELLNKLESLLFDPAEKLNVTRSGDFVADIYDLREWIEAQANPKRMARKRDPEASAKRSEAAKARWVARKAKKNADLGAVVNG